MFCSNCGCEILENERFCPGCGNMVANSGIKARKSINPVMWILVCAIAVFGVAISLFLGHILSDKKTVNNTEEVRSVDSLLSKEKNVIIYCLTEMELSSEDAKINLSYDYNDLGQLQSCKYHYIGADQEYVYTNSRYKWDSDGNLIFCADYSSKGELLEEHNFTFDSNGLLEKYEHAIIGSQIGIDYYFYDEDANLCENKKYIEYSDEFDLRSWEINEDDAYQRGMMEYTESGNLKSSVSSWVYEGEENKFIEFEYDYNSNNHISSIKNNYYEGNNVYDSIINFYYQYDSNGNVLSRSYNDGEEIIEEMYNKDELLTSISVDGALYAEYTYDKTGQIISEVYYDNAGNIVTTSNEDWFYDLYGQSYVKRTQSKNCIYDEDGNLMEEYYNGLYTVKCTYMSLDISKAVADRMVDSVMQIDKISYTPTELLGNIFRIEE